MNPETESSLPEGETTESKPKSLSQLSGLALMIAILIVAGILSALTAMRFAIRGREVVVPSLTGKTEPEAQALLQQQGLVLKVTSKRFSANIPEGRIVDQIPAIGTRLKQSRSVKVLLSLGDRKFAVPNLVGTSLRAAQLTLGQRRLTLGNTLYAHTPEGDPSTVVYQSPVAGTTEGSDPSVHILISLGPAEQFYIMPDLIGQPAELVASRARSEGFRIGKMNFHKYPGVEPGVVIQQKPQAGYRLSKQDSILLDVSQ
jgi:beta-lactam-binding protein with PASTA domain